MKARAPGKVVLSGAYAVLEGAPAIVCAVDRFARADAARSATFLTDEVRAAIAQGSLTEAPYFDAAELRRDGQKLGLGSSAAVLVASLAAGSQRLRMLQGDLLREALFDMALRAHREAQGGGSGIDVAASVFGGILRYRLTPSGPCHVAIRLPSQLHIEVWASPTAASTRDFIAKVQVLKRRSPVEYSDVLRSLLEASEDAARSSDEGDAESFLAALRKQRLGLASLGEQASIPIFTPASLELDALAAREGGLVLPAGAGGGDIALFVGQRVPSEALCSLREGLAHVPIAVTLGAPGVERLGTAPSPSHK